MPKQRKSSRGPRGGHPSLPRDLVAGLRDAEQLVSRHRWADARVALEALDRRYPNQLAILGMLGDVCLEVHDAPAFLHAFVRLSKVAPQLPDVALGLAEAYTLTSRPALALRTFRRFLSRWPNDARAASVRARAADLETIVNEMLAESGLAGEEGLELAGLNEETGYLLEHGQFAAARAVAEQILRRRPGFVPALNNLSQADALDGRLDQAIATATRVLAIAPDNLHALANLTRYLCLSGQVGEATRWAGHLTAAAATSPDRWAKQAEALSFLGDDQGVLAALEGATRTGELEQSSNAALLYHLAAVAALRLGQEAEARRAWQQALHRSPGLELAQANLADLHQPVGERHAPWAYSLDYWVAPKILQAMRTHLLAPAVRGGDEALGRALRRFARQHPTVVSLVPLLLDRGDPLGRELALKLAGALRTPAVLAALRDFAFSQRGPDRLRQEAANILTEAGLIEAGPVRLWLGGAWQEVVVLGFEITDEPDPPLPAPAQEPLDEAVQALRQQDGAAAERWLQQALAVVPDAPTLLHNLASAYELQGRRTEAHALVREVHARYPDYLFARVGVARLLITDGQLDEAEALLLPLLQRRRVHTSEFAALCQAMMSLYRQRQQPEAVRSWFALWESADPDHPGIERWRPIVVRLLER